MASDFQENGLKRAGVTTLTGRTADGSRRRTLQPAFSLLGVPAVATEPRGSSVLARCARPCGVWGRAPRATALPALSFLDTTELTRQERRRCTRGPR